MAVFLCASGVGEQEVELTAFVATLVTRSLCSTPKLLSAGCQVEVKPTHSSLHQEIGRP